MNLQECFNIAVAGVIAQGCPSTAHDQPDKQYAPLCRYRADLEPDCPIKCALGHLIPNEIYEPRMDQEMTTSDICQILNLSQFEPQLRSLQECHDTASSSKDFVGEFKRKVTEYARVHNLDTKVLTHGA